MPQVFTPEQVRASEVARFVAARRLAGLTDDEIRALLASPDPANPCLDLEGANACTAGMTGAAFSAPRPSRPGRGGEISTTILVAGAVAAVLILWRLF